MSEKKTNLTFLEDTLWVQDHWIRMRMDLQWFYICVCPSVCVCGGSVLLCYLLIVQYGVDSMLALVEAVCIDAVITTHLPHRGDPQIVTNGNRMRTV